MTGAVQIRRWAKEASAKERATTAAATAVVAVLLGWGLVPAPADRVIGGRDDAAASGSGGFGRFDDPVVGGPVDASSPTSLAVDPGGAGPTGGGPGASVPGPARPGGSFDPADPLGPVRPLPTGPLTATDRGVTADSIKVGFTIVGLQGATGHGIVTGFREDASEAIDAFVDYANTRGGVLGRRIRPVKVTADVADSADQRQRCLELTETHGVFAVVDSFALSSEIGTACVTAEHKTLLLNGNAGNSKNVRLGFPYHVSVLNDDNRKMKDLVAAAVSEGFFDPAKGFRKLGVWTEDCIPTVLDADDGLNAYLRAAGIDDWEEFRASCAEIGAQRRAATEAVLRSQREGVTHVFLVAHPPLVENYLLAAAAASYRPKYFAGDFFNLIVGGKTDEYESGGFDGALGVTQLHAGEGAVGKPLSPLAKTCSDILVARGLAPITNAPPQDLGDDIEVLELCEHFLLFLEAAKAAGPHLTRMTWVDALATVGDFRGATTDLARFDRRGKVNGGDTTKIVQWHRDCRCWKERTGFRPSG